MANEPSKEQLLAIEHLDGPMMVLAGPGSGKTYVITRRIEHMIKVHKVNASNILVITFTKASAMEMQERFEKLMGNEYAPVNFGTFHAIYFHIIKEEYNMDFSNIITEKEKYQYMKQVIDDINDDCIDNTMAEQLLTDISRIKNDGISPLDYKITYITNDIMLEIYNRYKKYMEADKKIDFEDMVLMCRNLFKNNSSILEKWRNIYRYILIDEFQDINPMQYEVIKMLAEPLYNLFVVGDDDQSIYGFRGSKPGIMLGFPDEYNDCKKILLSNNYRSTCSIVNNAVSFINHNKIRFMKDIKATKDSGRDIDTIAFNDKDEQQKYILKVINTKKRNGCYNDIAVIFRTNKATRLLTTTLTEHKIPYRFKDKPKSYFSHNVAKDIIAILSFANGENTRANFLRFMNKPVRYISRNMLSDTVIDLDKLINNNRDKQYLKRHLLKLKHDVNTIKNMDIFSAITYIRNGMQYEEFVIKEAKDKGADITEIKEIFALLKESSRGINTYKEYINFIKEYEDNLKESSETDDDEDRVTLITMHSSKGLEYDTVIIPDVNEGNVPQGKSLTDAAIEEERRVFYVAMTRAKENLILTYIKKNKENRLMPSRFINEIGIQPIS